MKIALLGDIAFIGAYDLTHNPKLQESLAPMSNYLAGFDYVIGNLETPFSYRMRPSGAKSAYICAHPLNGELLKLLHVDAVSLANNHMFDFGDEGYQTTIDTLTKLGIDYFGVDGREYMIHAQGNKILLNGFCCYSTNPQRIATHYGAKGINRFNVAEVSDILRQKSKEGFLNILSVHSGIEHVNYPSTEQIRVARLLGDIADYVYYGHHPHVIQGIETYKGSLVAHSLGNFCFDGSEGTKFRPQATLSEDNRRGMILELTVAQNRVTNSVARLIHIGEEGTLSFMNQDSDFIEYSSQLATALVDAEAYEQKRKEQRSVYVQGRLRQRNLRWVLKRLRPRYVRLYFSGYYNARQYDKNVKFFL